MKKDWKKKISVGLILVLLLEMMSINNGHWYYLNPVSNATQWKMLLGWLFIDGKWYYLNEISDGTKKALFVNTWIGEYYVDQNGVWVS